MIAIFDLDGRPLTPAFRGREEMWAHVKENFALLRNADFRGFDLGGVSLQGLNLTGANFENANCRGAKFFKCEFHHNSLVGANFSRAQFRGCTIADCLTSKARFTEAIFLRTPFLDLSTTGCETFLMQLSFQDLHLTFVDGQIHTNDLSIGYLDLLRCWKEMMGVLGVSRRDERAFSLHLNHYWRMYEIWLRDRSQIPSDSYAEAPTVNSLEVPPSTR